MNDPGQAIGAWFIGPKSENGDRLARMLSEIVDDHLYWRRNYFPEDVAVLSSEERRNQAAWDDQLSDRLLELLGRLKTDFPFFSPRYVAHMLAEQTLPSIVGYVAGMLYNPNNVTREAAPVTVRLELEASRMIAEMLGYDPTSCWAHLCSGGTVANTEALWVARSVRYLPLVLAEIAELMSLRHPLAEMDRAELMSLLPCETLTAFRELAAEAAEAQGETGSDRFAELLVASDSNVAEAGVMALAEQLGSQPAILVPETCHYSLPKIGDVLGIGRRAVLKVPVDSRFRMDIGAAEGILDELEASGRHPLAVVAVMGSTEEGAIDPLDELVELRNRRRAAGKPSFWIHGDAAWGGYLRTMLIPEPLGIGDAERPVKIGEKEISLHLDLPGEAPCRALMALGECDSITVDPHKMGYVPYPAGALCFRSNTVRPLIRQSAPYIDGGGNGVEAARSDEQIGTYILEGSKPGATAASVWLSHVTIPLDTSGHGLLVRDTIRNACELHALLDHWSELVETPVRAVTLCPPDSNIVCFCFTSAERPGPGLERINELNRRLYQRFSLEPEERARVFGQRFFLSRTVLDCEHYRSSSMSAFLDRLGVAPTEYRRHGVLLLRSTLMNPWLTPSRRKGRDLLVELTTELHQQAAEIVQDLEVG